MNARIGSMQIMPLEMPVCVFKRTHFQAVRSHLSTQDTSQPVIWCPLDTTDTTYWFYAQNGFYLHPRRLQVYFSPLLHINIWLCIQWWALKRFKQCCFKLRLWEVQLLTCSFWLRSSCRQNITKQHIKNLTFITQENYWHSNLTHSSVQQVTTSGSFNASSMKMK